MSITTCDGECDRELITSNPEGVHYCPDCAAAQPSHSAEYQRRQARSQRAAENRARIIDNRRVEGDR